MAKMAKVMRYEIIKPVDTTWEVFGKLLRDLQYDTRQLLNKSVQLCWEYQGFSSDYKERHGEYPKAKEVLGYSGIDGYIYNKVKDEFTRLNTGNLSQTLKRAVDKWKSDVKDILKGDKSIPNFKKDVPIDVKSDSIKLIKENNKYSCKLGLVSRTYQKEMERKSGQFEVALMAVDNSQKQILDRLIDGIYKLGSSQILRSKNKWFLNICYQFESEEKQLDENNIMGIDMGIVNPVYVAFNNSLQRFRIEGDEITKFRKSIEARRNSLLKQGKYCGDGRIGHGRVTRLKPIQKLQDKVDNFKKTTNHKYSRYIIELAVKNNCGVIQMEDLTGIAEGDKKASFLGGWTYYDLQQKIEYKAKEIGIKVVKVKPNFTSQRCSKCGHIHKENRKDQATFECVSCGFKVNADYNAARNIATKDIEKIIEEQLKKQEKEERNNKKYIV